MIDTLKDFITAFDQHLAAKYTGKMYGLAELFTANDETYPATIAAKRERIAPSDSWQLQTYHRTLSANQLPTSEEFGEQITISQNMMLVVITDVKLGEDVIYRITKDMLLQFSGGIGYAVIEDGWIITTDAEAIGRTEFGNAWTDKYRVLKNIYTITYQLSITICK